MKLSAILGNVQKITYNILELYKRWLKHKKLNSFLYILCSIEWSSFSFVSSTKNIMYIVDN